MDLWTVHVKSTNLSPVCIIRNLKPSLGNFGKVGVFEIRVLRGRVVSSSNVYQQSLLVTAMAKKNHDNTSGNLILISGLASDYGLNAKFLVYLFGFI